MFPPPVVFAGHDAAGEFSIDRKFKNQRPEDTEQVWIQE